MSVFRADAYFSSVCVRVCVRACFYAYVCVRACVRACVRTCVCMRVCERERRFDALMVYCLWLKIALSTRGDKINQFYLPHTCTDKLK